MLSVVGAVEVGLVAVLTLVVAALAIVEAILALVAVHRIVLVALLAW